MKIVYPEDKNKVKEYLWETAKVRAKIPKLRINPKLSTTSYANDKRDFIGCVIFTIFIGLMAILIKFNPILVFFFFLFIILEVIWKKRFNIVDKMVDKEDYLQKEKSLTITKEQIIHETKGEISISYYWESIEFVLIRDHSINFIPKDGILSIAVPIEMKDEVLKEISKQKIKVSIHDIQK